MDLDAGSVALVTGAAGGIGAAVVERLRAEAVAPARAGRAVCYKAYSCREGTYLPPRVLGPAPLVIVEGRDSILVCPVDQAQRVKEVVETLEKEGRTERL